MPHAKLLIVDDDPVFLRNIKRLMETQGYNVTTISNPQLVMEHLKSNGYNCILLDVKLPIKNGLDLFKDIKKAYPELPIIFISGESTINTAVEALKMGAYDFFEKPIDIDRLLISVQNAIEKHSLWEEKENILKELKENFQLIGNSPALKKIALEIRKAAEVNTKVLITGESGVGKELVAWAIHHHSSRKAKPYVRINCASIPSELLEAELFGYRKGAFTGAFTDRQGKFMAANGGTLFLDEIGDLDFRLQGKILRVLEENEIEIIGEPTPKKIDVRIIAATNQKLEQLVRENKFRLDLFHRLNVIRIHIPPLRERKEDILPLAYFFLKKFNETYNKKIQRIHPLAQEILLNYHWPGNVRELRNLIEKIVIFTDEEEISADGMLNAIYGNNNVENPLYNTSIFDGIVYIHTAHKIFEKNYLQYVLEKVGGKKTEAAKLLGIDRSNLYKKLRKHGLISPRS